VASGVLHLDSDALVRRPDQDEDLGADVDEGVGHDLGQQERRGLDQVLGAAAHQRVAEDPAAAADVSGVGVERDGDLDGVAQRTDPLFRAEPSGALGRAGASVTSPGTTLR
jgi:hypothetical protein